MHVGEFPGVQDEVPSHRYGVDVTPEAVKLRPGRFELTLPQSSGANSSPESRARLWIEKQGRDDPLRCFPDGKRLRRPGLGDDELDERRGVEIRDQSPRPSTTRSLSGPAPSIGRGTARGPRAAAGITSPSLMRRSI